MTSVTLVTVAVCLFVCVYATFPQYDSSYFGPHNGYPYGRHGPYFPPRRLALEGAFGSVGGNSGAGNVGMTRSSGGAGVAGMVGRAGMPESPGMFGNGATNEIQGSAGRAVIPGRPRNDASGNTQPRRPLQKLPQLEGYVNPQDAVVSSVLRTTDQYFYKPVPVGFDNVTTNINGGYIREYGVFTAPVPGIYFINYHIQSKKGSAKEAHVDLTQNGEVVNSAKAEGDCVPASNSAVLYLDQFDRLSVNGRERTVIGCENNGFCSFSVSLVKQGKFYDQKVARAVPKGKW
ncbi:complement C1q-like protein 4 [Liolophura sinensis]|uniref:complement C1q-like protein 4 n=1 Tax=Liolophura sinensis TaxID=3198878 RepID=UPI0031589CD0